jgi:hypothetical protein
MNAQEPDGNRAGSTETAWWKRSYFNLIFSLMSAMFFVTAGFIIIFSQEWSATGRAGVSFLCAFSCALVGNLDKFESVKASISGFEAKTREMARAVDEARVALQEFHVLAEMTGSVLIELMTGEGRAGGGPSDHKDARRSRIVDALTAIGLTPEAIKRVDRSDDFWVKIDYSLGIINGIQKSALCSDKLKTEAKDMIRRWNDEDFRPTPDDFTRTLESGVCSDASILDLAQDYRYFVENGEHRRPAVWRDRHSWGQLR